jgi:ATP-binding protein involved in chromosome partitioning
MQQNNKKPTTYGTFENPNDRAKFAKHVIAVTSGKGGVGKSTVSANLSVALAQAGFKVGILDADIYGPDIPRLLNIRNDTLKWSSDDKIIPSENYGLKIMSVGITTPTPDTPLVWRSSVAVSALVQLIEDVAWGELDFLVIDMPPGTGDIQLTVAQEMKISAGILVTTPQAVATDDVSRAIRMFQDIKVPIAGIIENMSYFVTPDTKARYDIFGSGGGEMLAANYGVNLLGQIPLLMQVRELSDEGMPPVAHADEEYKKYYRDIAESLVDYLKVKQG